MDRTGERGMAWFTLYLLNLLWATAGTSTQTQSSCCEYAMSPKELREAGTLGLGRDLAPWGLLMRKRLETAVGTGIPTWVRQGVRVLVHLPSLNNISSSRCQSTRLY